MKKELMKTEMGFEGFLELVRVLKEEEAKMKKSTEQVSQLKWQIFNQIHGWEREDNRKECLSVNWEVVRKLI